jgi:hypothetical protein
VVPNTRLLLIALLLSPEMQEAAAARARLVCLRNRLAELRSLNSDRQQRAAELQERVAGTEVRCAAGCSSDCSARIILAVPPVYEAQRDR